MATPGPLGLTLDELGEALGAASTVLRANAMAAGLDAPVPTCPGWTVLDLVAHQGMVHRWAASHLRGEPTTSPNRWSARGASRPTSLGWFDDGATALLQAIVDAPDDLDALVFLEDARRPRLFWARRQCHETTIHAVDALGARLGRPPRADETWIRPAVALDGIDELLVGFVTRRREGASPAPRPGCSCAPTARTSHGSSTSRRAGRSPRRWSTASPEEAGADHALTGDPVDLYLPPVEPRRPPSRPTRSSAGGATRSPSPGDPDPLHSRMGAAPTAPQRTGLARPEEPYAAGGHRPDRPVRHLPGGRLRPPPAGAHRRHAARGGRPQGRCRAAGSPTSPARPAREATARANGRRSTGGRWCPACSSTPRERDTRRRALRPSAREPLLVAPIGVLSMAHAEADLAVARGGPRAAGHPDPQHPGLGADGGGRRASSVAPGTGTSSTGAATTTSSRASSRRAEACGSEALVVTLDTAYLGWRPRDLDLGHLPFARGEGIAQYTSDPVFRAARRRAGRRAARPSAEPRPRPTPAAVAHPAVDEPQPPGRHPRTTYRARAARRGRDVPRRVLPAVADAGTTCRGCAR